MRTQHKERDLCKIKDEDIVTLVDQFPGQSIGVEKISKRLVNSREGPPVFEQPEMTLEKLMEYGNMLVMEQENVKRVQLHCVTCVAGKSAQPRLVDLHRGDGNHIRTFELIKLFMT
ncbi:hypothetical protein HID58_036315 [Brassica napus]|uniref:Ribulose bisphosphate carboxylase/oxygenase activase AAA helical domain-containing protein n=1 Tax=Brassica napus TaxID=3708 RepID=A0ABQ8C7E4_BRANA|nr:hypothetical protein HID58_036315 [Brassica napus]